MEGDVSFVSNPYGYPVANFNKAEDIQPGKHHYTYNGVDFFYDFKSKKNKLVVVFHAAISVSTKLPVFRGHDWDIENSNVLSISDAILGKYREYNKSRIVFDASFFLNTEKVNYHDHYVYIISTVLGGASNGNSVFFGTSAGGLAALLFGSIFESVVIIGNSQFYIDKWWNIDNTKKVINRHDDNNIILVDIERFLIENRPPKKLVMFTNVLDEMCYEKHHVPMIEFFEKNFPDRLDVIYHSECWTSKYHTTHFPAATPYLSLIESASTIKKKVEVFTNDKLWAESFFRKLNIDVSVFLFSTIADEELSSVCLASTIVVTLLNDNCLIPEALRELSSWVLRIPDEDELDNAYQSVDILVNDRVLRFKNVIVAKPEEKMIVATNG